MCLFICSFLNLLSASYKYKPKTDPTSHRPLWSPFWAMEKSYKELHLANLLLAANSDIIFLPSHLNLIETKSCPHARKENNVVDKRKEIHVGEYNRKAQAKSRINPANISKQSQCKTQLWWAPEGGLLGISSSVFVGVYKSPVAHSPFCHEKCVVTNPTFFFQVVFWITIH